uniref:Fibronectin type-III domain-containing protein n=1 Tax=Candidatus Kentrum sp. FW TaxID=2126338 RepID=A0A450TRE8_9GAMM|nr:MAG: hypothetical protein BECKFW1821C_GA0114237_102432 [Candidatus Kentron sp. FW]
MWILNNGLLSFRSPVPAYEPSIGIYRRPSQAITRHAPTPLAVPGQARSLHVTTQGWLEMDWKKPADGGRVATYRIQRREAGVGPWTLVEIAMETEARLVDQARGSMLEYCVVATNKAGEGEASNTVTVSL